ncbi:hypothetical protein ACROYT_G027949 [Oculina patagonica]
MKKRQRVKDLEHYEQSIKNIQYGLGFLIAGGKKNHHVPNDDSIYITEIYDGVAQQDGRLQVGDKIIRVNDTSLEGVTLEDAFATIKKTENEVVIIVTRVGMMYADSGTPPLLYQEAVKSSPPPPPSPPKDEKPTVVLNPPPQVHQTSSLPRKPQAPAEDDGFSSQTSFKNESGQFTAIARTAKESQHDLNLITINAVPPEILARGPLALQAYNKALAEGMTCHKRVPVMLIGQERSGKTSVKKSLRGEPFNRNEGSTVGIDVDPSHFKVTTEFWKIREKDQETNSETAISYEHHAARLTVENLRQEKSIPKERVSQESIQSGNIPLVETVPGSVSSDSISASSASDVTNASNHDLSQVVTKDFTRDPQPGGIIPDMPEDIATLIEMRLKGVDEMEDEEDIYSILWDFAGQWVYNTTHPLFLTSRASYLLIYDLSQNPLERAKSVVKQGMFGKFEDFIGFKTNLDYLDFWMSSVASQTIQDERQQEYWKSLRKSEVFPEKLPAVFLVCTHADVPYGGRDPTSLAQEVFGFLQTKPYEIHLYGDVFVVDNTKSGHKPECSEVKRLREEVLAVSKELPQMKQPIPIKWLKYEKALQVMKEDGHKRITLERAQKIASEVCGIVEDKEFQTVLDFLHDQRILIHFDDTPELSKLVVLNLQWLIDVFKAVITIKPYRREEKEFKNLWGKLQKEGILDEKLLKHVWAPFFDDKETSDSLIAIMEKFSLLCPWPSSDASCGIQYLVPSMLMSFPPEDLMNLVTSARIPPLFLKFESGQVPAGLFPRLVLQFFQWSKEEFWRLGKPQFYHNFARFHSHEEEDCSVILLCHSSSIEVVVHSGNSINELAERLQSERMTLSSEVNFDVTCARAVRRCLELILESMRKEFCWLKNMKYEVSFLCPVCCQGGGVNRCSTHMAQGCKQEECLHFWSESQFCNVKKIPSCTEPGIAQSSKVQIKQFAPWFAPLGNQLTADEHNGRFLANVEARQEIALPGEVVESLLSQSCDAKEVVLQFKESLQPVQVSLEQPKPETKTLIRCLARKAKDLNRLDVFEHLREITPAGTTGPLLPEHLDVGNIPFSKGRELTIDLSGGDEWKVVAEGLGLSPREIRFLDKRTLNPIDAALAFIAKQRLVTVGELYDLLCKSGYPVLADLL